MSEISWEADGCEYTLRVHSGDVEMLLPGHGWLHGVRLYRLHESAMHGPGDTRDWTVVSAEPRQLGPDGDGSVWVVESALSTDPIEPYDSFETLRAWQVPHDVARFPEHLLGCGASDIERRFLRSVAVSVLDQRVRLDRAEDVPAVPLAQIEEPLAEMLWREASRLAEAAGLSLEPEPVGAARLYTESEPDEPPYETVCCWWEWRVAYRVRQTSTRGILTLGISGFGVDEKESAGVNNVNPASLSAWIALPAERVAVGARMPGAPIACSPIAR